MVKMKLLVSFLYFLSLSCFAQVGINTITPEATLDINGNLKIRTTGVVSNSTTRTTSLVVDDTTKEIKRFKAAGYTINYITYNLNNVNQDWVADFDTKIDARNYALVIVGSSFDKNLSINYPDPGVYSPVNVYTFRWRDTWHISADYKDSETFRNENGNWTINCLIISKILIKEMPTVSVDMHGSENGSLASAPAGL